MKPDEQEPQVEERRPHHRDEADVEGHRRHFEPSEKVAQRDDTDDDGPDVEGHRRPHH